MVLIFGMSSQNGEESGGLSKKVSEIICSVFIPDFEDLPGAEQELYISKLNYPVRKCAHMTEYCILAILYYCTLVSITKRAWVRIVISFTGATLYAVTDEIHQLFVGGRAGAFTDVLFDSAGALLGLIIIMIGTGIVNRRRKPVKPA